VTISFDRVETALRERTFGTLSTLTERGAPHATGVIFAVSARGEPLALYVTTRTTTRKVRNLRAYPEVAFDRAGAAPVPSGIPSTGRSIVGHRHRTCGRRSRSEPRLRVILVPPQESSPQCDASSPRVETCASSGSVRKESCSHTAWECRC
jgi:hypothetical protein